jgi:uncharacterized protein (TIGR03118 family)
MWNPKLVGGAVVCLGALGTADVMAVVPPNRFVQTNLVSSPDGPPADFRNENLINSWGLVTLGNGDFWTANNGTSTATLFRSNGSPEVDGTEPVIVSVPGAPTGLAQNNTTGFLIQSDDRVAPSNLIFVTESGTILGYNPEVEPSRAVVAVDFSGFNSVFKGTALFPGPFGSRLYAADFVNGLVETFDDNFELISTFEDDPDPPFGFAPFNVATIGNSVFVAFAKQQPGETDEAHGPGLGFIDQYDTEGHLLRRFATGGELNAPWGMVRAPFGFGPFAGALLVGNFGDGNINAFNFVTGAFLGKLQHCDSGSPVVIDGLWGLDFGKSPALRQSLFFASGPADEAQGLAGTLRPGGS